MYGGLKIQILTTQYIHKHPILFSLQTEKSDWQAHDINQFAG